MYLINSVNKLLIVNTFSSPAQKEKNRALNNNKKNNAVIHELLPSI